MAVELNVDISDLREAMETVGHMLSQETRNKMLRYTISDTQRKVKKILKDQFPKDYAVQKSWVGKAVGYPKNESRGNITTVKIPVRGPRIAWGQEGGGQRFVTKAGMPGWTSTQLNGRRYKISAEIIKGERSTLPVSMNHYSEAGNAPFINTIDPKNKKISKKKREALKKLQESRKKRSLNMIAFARVGKAQLPVVPIKGIAIPQMLTNRSEDEVREEIHDYMAKRLAHHFDRAWKGQI